MKFFQRLYRFYFYFIFILLFLPLYPAFYFLLKDPKYHPKAQKLRHFWANALLFLTGIRYRITGKENLEKGKVYIICGNHNSHLDIVVLGAGLRIFYGFMAKAELGRIPLFGIFFRTIDISVEREDAVSSAGSFRAAIKALQSKKSLVIFPEGGIKEGPELLKPFKEGPFKLAVRLKIPILPVSLPDNPEFLPDDSPYAKPGKVRLILHKPIETAHLSDADVPELSRHVFQIIENDLIVQKSKSLHVK